LTMMGDRRKMVDRGTGASPPPSNQPKREFGCSPIRSMSSMEMSTFYDYGDEGVRMMNTSEDRMHTLNRIDTFRPQFFSTTSSSDSTLVLALSSSKNPMPLMSIGFNRDGHSSNGPAAVERNFNNRWNHLRDWPISPPAYYNFKYHQRRVPSTRRNQ
ncbi:unnamed protein product, partial [Adineta ricciae]